MLDDAVAVSAGDTLVVTAEDGNTITKYTISVDPLDSNTALNVKSGSSLSIADEKVTGIIPGTKLKTVLDEVETASSLSVLNVLNTAGELVPLKSLNPVSDFLYFKGSEVSDVQIFDITWKMVKIAKTPDNSVNVSELGKGVYLVVINTREQNKIIVRMIKQ